jgi:HAMP domain-containing protein
MGDYQGGSGDYKPMPTWSIVILVLGFTFTFMAMGALLWFTRKPTINLREREEARREIDLERLSLEAEVRFQRQRKAEVEEIETKERAMAEVRKTDSAGNVEEEVVVQKLAKGHDVV